MKTLAFMQNQWFKQPELHRRQMDRYKAQGQEAWMNWRAIFIKRALFFRCRSGIVLRQLLGELCDSIIWDEASPVIHNNPRDCPPADPEHMRSIAEHHKPELIVLFGSIARKGWMPVQMKGLEFGYDLIHSPHPTCRAPKDHLALAAACARILVMNAPAQNENIRYSLEK